MVFNNPDVDYDHARGAWICYDNHLATAAQIKELHPYDPVFLHNRDTGHETQYFITIKHRKPHMKNGKFVHEEEEIKV